MKFGCQPPLQTCINIFRIDNMFYHIHLSRVIVKPPLNLKRQKIANYAVLQIGQYIYWFLLTADLPVMEADSSF